MAAAVGAGEKSRLSRLLRERVGVVHNPEVEEKEVTCTIKVSIVFPQQLWARSSASTGTIKNIHVGYLGEIKTRAHRVSKSHSSVHTTR